MLSENKNTFEYLKLKRLRKCIIYLYWMTSYLAGFCTILTVRWHHSLSLSTVLSQHLLLRRTHDTNIFRSLKHNKNTYCDVYVTPLLTSGPTLWIMRSFLGIGALEVSSWEASVSVTMVVLSSSSRGLLDMEEVPGVAETGR